MIYPDNFETKIGFNDIRAMLSQGCMSTLGKGMVEEMVFLTSDTQIREKLKQISEFRQLLDEHDDFPMQYFFDVRESMARLRLEGTYLEENELFDLKRSLETITAIVAFLNRNNTQEDTDSHVSDKPSQPAYPTLHKLTIGIETFPQVVRRIEVSLDKFGNIKDSASTELAHIRHELSKAQGSVTRSLYSILKTAQSEGVIEKDVTPTLRDGRLVIPVPPGMKRRIRGIVHDESASGRTVFVEPSEVVEANNKIRELENEERKEIIRILKDIAALIRPHSEGIISSMSLLANIDFINAKASLAKTIGAIEPNIAAKPLMDWRQARHPLLQLSLATSKAKALYRSTLHSLQTNAY